MQNNNNNKQNNNKQEPTVEHKTITSDIIRYHMEVLPGIWKEEDEEKETSRKYYTTMVKINHYERGMDDAAKEARIEYKSVISALLPVIGIHKASNLPMTRLIGAQFRPLKERIDEKFDALSQDEWAELTETEATAMREEAAMEMYDSLIELETRLLKGKLEVVAYDDTMMYVLPAQYNKFDKDIKNQGSRTRTPILRREDGTPAVYDVKVHFVDVNAAKAKGEEIPDALVDGAGLIINTPIEAPEYGVTYQVTSRVLQFGVSTIAKAGLQVCDVTKFKAYYKELTGRKWEIGDAVCILPLPTLKSYDGVDTRIMKVCIHSYGMTGFRHDTMSIHEIENTNWAEGYFEKLQEQVRDNVARLNDKLSSQDKLLEAARNTRVWSEDELSSKISNMNTYAAAGGNVAFVGDEATPYVNSMINSAFNIKAEVLPVRVGSTFRHLPEGKLIGVPSYVIIPEGGHIPHHYRKYAMSIEGTGMYVFDLERLITDTGWVNVKRPPTIPGNVRFDIKYIEFLDSTMTGTMVEWVANLFGADFDGDSELFNVTHDIDAINFDKYLEYRELYEKRYKEVISIITPYAVRDGLISTTKDGQMDALANIKEHCKDESMLAGKIVKGQYANILVGILTNVTNDGIVTYAKDIETYNPEQQLALKHVMAFEACETPVRAIKHQDINIIRANKSVLGKYFQLFIGIPVRKKADYKKIRVLKTDRLIRKGPAGVDSYTMKELQGLYMNRTKAWLAHPVHRLGVKELNLDLSWTWEDVDPNRVDAIDAIIEGFANALPSVIQGKWDDGNTRFKLSTYTGRLMKCYLQGIDDRYIDFDFEEENVKTYKMIKILRAIHPMLPVLALLIRMQRKYSGKNVSGMMLHGYLARDINTAEAMIEYWMRYHDTDTSSDPHYVYMIDDDHNEEVYGSDDVMIPSDLFN